MKSKFDRWLRISLLNEDSASDKQKEDARSALDRWFEERENARQAGKDKVDIFELPEETPEQIERRKQIAKYFADQNRRKTIKNVVPVWLRLVIRKKIFPAIEKALRNANFIIQPSYEGGVIEVYGVGTVRMTMLNNKLRKRSSGFDFEIESHYKNNKGEPVTKKVSVFFDSKDNCNAQQLVNTCKALYRDYFGQLFGRFVPSVSNDKWHMLQQLIWGDSFIQIRPVGADRGWYLSFYGHYILKISTSGDVKLVDDDPKFSFADFIYDIMYAKAEENNVYIEQEIPELVKYYDL